MISAFDFLSNIPSPIFSKDGMDKSDNVETCIDYFSFISKSGRHVAPLLKKTLKCLEKDKITSCVFLMSRRQPWFLRIFKGINLKLENIFQRVFSVPLIDKEYFFKEGFKTNSSHLLLQYGYSPFLKNNRITVNNIYLFIEDVEELSEYFKSVLKEKAYEWVLFIMLQHEYAHSIFQKRVIENSLPDEYKIKYNYLNDTDKIKSEEIFADIYTCLSLKRVGAPNFIINQFGLFREKNKDDIMHNTSSHIFKFIDASKNIDCTKRDIAYKIALFG